MSGKFRVAGLVSRVDREEALNLSSEIIKYLEKSGVKVSVELELAKKLGHRDIGVSIENMNVDFMVVIGGDGTILRTCLSLPKPEPPILAVNMGLRGFLTDVLPKNALRAIERLLKGEFIVEKHSKLASFMNDERLPDALNEVFVTADLPVKIMHARIWKNKTLVGEAQADGFMVASQVGSTGYSLSAGGPVLDPQLEAFVLTPVCALTTFHPIVFPSNCKLTIEVVKPKTISVVIDGHYRKFVEAENLRVVVGRSEHETRFIRFKEDFYQRLKNRLLFSGGIC